MSYRSFKNDPIERKKIEEIVKAGSLAPSCFNNQPWRYVVVDTKEDLEKLYPAIAEGNYWMKLAPVIIAIVSHKDFDCVIKSRTYHQFDTGMATGFMLLKAQELGIHTHLVAGYSPSKTRKILGIPEDMEVVSLMALGYLSEDLPQELSDQHKSIDEEKLRGKRAKRHPLEKILHYNGYDGKKDEEERQKMEKSEDEK
ncbi:nitroreductase [Isachenkonia alkalipeptolytica]|uniref:Nitroreductase n=2 Tax=Isachenkonia alkalipeptolytica TaxID=2565777 RepID=A0AA44BDU7_9CLOT|nr:nitroreductase [Isachenkonia alkalipeptolytica]